ncbi:hypothetical protein ACHQM5_021410 [Ranunculus cassubicifolius]
MVEGNTNLESLPIDTSHENVREEESICEEFLEEFSPKTSDSAANSFMKHENGDSSISTNIDQVDDPIISTSQENAGELDAIHEEIMEASPANTFDSSATHETDSSVKHENGDSSTSTDIDQSNDPIIATSQGELEAIHEEIVEGSHAKTSDSSATHGTDSFVKHENGDPSTSTNIDQSNDPIIATSHENAGGLDNIYEEIMEGSSATQGPDSLLKHENGDSPTSTTMMQSNDPIMSQVDCTIALQAHKRTFSDVPTKFQLDTAILPSNLHKRTHSFDHVIDTAAPIESVKEAVSKFGEIVDWKAHKAATEEKRKLLQSEIEKTEEEILRHKKHSEEAKDSNNKALSELASTKKIIAELKLNFERAQTDEHQAKQDSKLANLKVKQVQQGIDARVAAIAELEVAKTRHAGAVAELKSVKDELEKLRGEYSCLIVEKDLAVKRAEEAHSASIEVEKTVEMLKIELTTVKEFLESAHASHLEAEERRLKAEIAKAQDLSDHEKELRQAEAELEKLNQENQSKQEIKLKLEDATTLLVNLKAELATYKEGKPNQEKSEDVENTTSELEEIISNIEKATTKVNYLKVAFASLQSELEQEKMAVSTIKNREGMASITVASLETEIETISLELELIRMENEGKNNIVEVPNQLDQATEKKDQCKSLALSAHIEMSKAKEDGELVKNSASTIDRRLYAVQKEIEASCASERLALAAAKALEKSELIRNNNDDENTPKGVTLSLEEYQALSKKAYDVEEKAHCKLAAVIALIEEAMSSEMRSLERLEQVNREMAEKKEEYTNAIEAAEKAAKGKLAVEHELRKWRTERRASDVGVVTTTLPRSRTSSIEEIKQRFERSSTAPAQPNAEEFLHGMETDSSSEAEVLKKKKKKRSLFPRIVMFLAKRKVQSKIL